MKKRYLFTAVVLLTAYFLSACGAAPQPAAQQTGEQAAFKVQVAEVAFTGVVEAINGNAWTVNGQALSVDLAVVRDGPFQVGDTIKVEGIVNADGSLSISRVESPSAADLTTLAQLGNDNVNANSNDANSNDANANVNSNDDNSNDTNLNANSNDDDSDDTNLNANSDDDSNGNINDNNNNDDRNGGSNDNGSQDNHDGGGNSNDD